MECNNHRISDKVIIADTLDDISKFSNRKYIAHALCTDGCAKFLYNDREFKISQGDLVIIRKGNLVDGITVSDNFKVKVIYIDATFAELATPATNYGMKGSVALFLNPVIPLSTFQYNVCLEDFANIERRLQATCYRFYEEGLRCAVQLMILDFFDFHARIYGESTVTPQFASIISRFFQLLDSGIYRQHREVSYYASELCITPKYLSEVCKKVSGHSANFWINRYTALEISRQLRDNRHSIIEIACQFNFSSPAYFSRYVQKNLGRSPSDYRE